MNFLSSLSNSVASSFSYVRTAIGDSLSRSFSTTTNAVQTETVEKVKHTVPQIIRRGNALFSEEVSLTSEGCLKRIEAMTRAPIRVRDYFPNPQIKYPFPVSQPSDRATSYGTFKGWAHFHNRCRPINLRGDIEYAIVLSDKPNPKRPAPLNISYMITAPEEVNPPVAPPAEVSVLPTTKSFSQYLNLIQSKYLTEPLKKEFTDICSRVVAIPTSGNLRPHAAARLSRMVTGAVINSVRETVREVEACMQNRAYQPDIRLEVFEKVKDRIEGISGYLQESVGAEFFTSFRRDYSSLKKRGQGV